MSVRADWYVTVAPEPDIARDDPFSGVLAHDPIKMLRPLTELVYEEGRLYDEGIRCERKTQNWGKPHCCLGCPLKAPESISSLCCLGLDQEREAERIQHELGVDAA